MEDENQEELLETKRGETRGKKRRTLENEDEEPLDEEEREEENAGTRRFPKRTFQKVQIWTL